MSSEVETHLRIRVAELEAEREEAKEVAKAAVEDFRDRVVGLINEARNEGECDLRQVRGWVECEPWSTADGGAR